MQSQCSFKNATVSELIEMVKREVEAYKTNKNPECLRASRDCLEQARQTLLRARIKTGLNDKKRLDEIERKLREVNELKEKVEKL